MKKVLNKLFGLDNGLSRFSLRLLREYRVKSYEKKDFKVLEVSGGSMPISQNYLNVDISNHPEVDLVTNLLEPIPLPENSVNKIVSIATLEHFNVNDLQMILKDFYRLLKKGGTVEIGVPSLSKVIEEYNKRGCDDVVLRYLHGGLKDQYDVHYFVADAARFIEELKKVGFSEAKEVDYDFERHSADFMMKIVAKK